MADGMNEGFSVPTLVPNQPSLVRSHEQNFSPSERAYLSLIKCHFLFLTKKITNNVSRDTRLNLTRRRIKEPVSEQLQEKGALKNLGTCFPEVKEPAVRIRKQSNAGLGWESVKRTYGLLKHYILESKCSIHTGLNQITSPSSQMLTLCFELLGSQGRSSKPLRSPLFSGVVLLKLLMTSGLIYFSCTSIPDLN